MSIWKRAGVVLGAVGAVGALAGAGLAAQRVAARRLRARSDPDAGVVTAADVDATWRLPSHDGGELYVVERGTGPVIVLSHGVTLSVRTWSKQLRSLADAGFQAAAA